MHATDHLLSNNELRSDSVSASSAGLGLIQASMKTVYDTEAVAKAARRLDGAEDASRQLARLYERMIEIGGERIVVKPARMPDLDPLYESLPNFAEVLDEVKRALALCVDSSDPIEIQPILLAGDPGVGKTHFCQAVAKLFGTGFNLIPMSSQTAGFILSGASSQWKNSKPGKVFDVYMNGEYANPVFGLDEIDKASSGAIHDPLGPLYTLLEPETAKRFIDEYVEVPIDTTGALWVATCNDVDRIPEPIVSRMAIFEIRTPDIDQSRRIAKIIYREIRESHDWGQHFPEQPTEDVLALFSSITPRAMRREILKAFANAKLARRYDIVPGDVSQVTKKQSMGFV